MKIGIFDSGLGGLVVGTAIMQALPEYDFVYLGDTKRVPYGNRSQETVHEFTKEAVDFLFKEGCQLIILACNTASAEALRKIQQEYLPVHYPDRRVLGVIIPTAEVVADAERIGILATAGTVHSQAFTREITKVNPSAQVTQQAAPLLVPLIENDGLAWVRPVLEQYLTPLQAIGIESLVLGCTHYAIIKDTVRDLLPEVTVIAQDEVLPAKVAGYLKRHPEIESRLQKNGARRFLVTDLSEEYKALAQRLCTESVTLELTDITSDVRHSRE